VRIRKSEIWFNWKGEQKGFWAGLAIDVGHVEYIQFLTERRMWLEEKVRELERYEQSVKDAF